MAMHELLSVSFLSKADLVSLGFRVAFIRSHLTITVMLAFYARNSFFHVICRADTPQNLKFHTLYKYLTFYWYHGCDIKI